MFLLQTISVYLVISQVFGGVLILSPKKTDISGLRPFDLTAYEHLKQTFKKGKIVSFKMNSEQIPEECEHLLMNKFTAYVPTVDYIPENVIVLKDKGEKQSCDEIKKTIHVFDLEGKKNVLYLIIHNSMKVKRQIDEEYSSSTTIISTTEESTTLGNKDKQIVKEKFPFDVSEAVLYDSNGKSMIYSSRASIFRRINDTEVLLGAATVVTFDERDNYSRLSCTIPVEDGKITLRFRFPWKNGYWALTLVEVEDNQGKIINLSNTKDVSAPEAFSHACGGETIFTDSNGTVTLTMFDLQVQPKARDRQFGDAYNCVPFVTGPICSGIFVSSILAVGLFLGLSALGSIKTMDKFDNSKTKQLTFTLVGE